MPDNAYDTFARQLAEDASARRIPVNGSFEITFRCNLKCVMCYNNLPGNDPVAKADELTLPEIQKYMDQMADAGCLWLQLTGGEVLMRPDFREIYLYAKSKGFLIRLFTNGTMLTPEIVDFLAENRPFSIEISLYGATKDTYEAITQVPGSYKKCLRAIEMLIDKKLPLSLKTVAITLNQHELAQMQQLCDDWGLNFRYDPDINPRIDGDKTNLKYRLTPAEVVRLDQMTPSRHRELSSAVCSPRERPAGDVVPLYDCSAGETAFHMNPYGELTPCIMTRKNGYNLRAGSFTDAWERVFAAIRLQTRPRTEDEPASYHHCTGWAQLENEGDAESAVMHSTLIARLREKTFARL